MLNLNDAPRQRNFDPIPDGSFVRLVMNYKAGGADLPDCDQKDKGLFKNSKSSDAVMLECEFTVDGGPHAHRKWAEHWTVAGGNLDEKGNSKGWNMTKQRIRAMIESAANIKPDDESPDAKAGRMVPNFKELDGIPFYAKIRVEEGEDYIDAEGQTKKGFDKNLIDRIVTPDMEEYAPLVRGETVAPKPSGRSTKKAAGVASGTASAAEPRWKRADAPGPTAPQATLPGTDTAATSSGPKWLRKA